MKPHTLADLTPDALRSIWDELDIGIAFVAEDGYFVAANPAYCALTERTEYELQKLTFQDITSPEDQEADAASARLVAEGKKDRYTMSKTYIGKFTPRIPVHLTVTAIHDGNDDFKVFLAQARPQHMFDQQPWRQLVDGIETFNTRLDSELPLTGSEARLGMFIAQNLWKILGGLLTLLGAFGGMIYALAA